MTRHILHITPHLGGGVGRVLSQVARYHHAHRTGVQEKFVCLEAPEKTQFTTRLEEAGAAIYIAPDAVLMQELLGWADIVQLEWWHHPLALQWLASMQGVTCRMVIWAHSSGLHYPQFPQGLETIPHIFMVSTQASLRERQENTVLVPSSGGFDGRPLERKPNSPLRFGYMGSLNAAKLHPDIMNYLYAVSEPDFSVRFYGDREPGMPVQESQRVRLMGYTNDPAAALAEMDVFVYVLNPQHYGTTENVLLEAMNAGVVPVVLDNPVEKSIVQHGETGLVVDSPEVFAEAVAMLADNPDMWQRMSRAAMADIRKRFGLERTVEGLRGVYDKVMALPPKPIEATSVIGDTPLAWLQTGLGKHAELLDENRQAERRQHAFFYERSKSSPFHFYRYFSQDAALKAITDMLDAIMAEAYIDHIKEILSHRPATVPAVDRERPVALYGAGKLGKMALEFLQENGVQVKAVLDRKAEAGSKLGDMPVLQPDVLPDNSMPLLVTVVNFPYMPIQQTLRQQGWETVLPFYDYAQAFSDVHPLNNGWFAGELDEEDKNRIMDTAGIWADDASKAFYAQFVAWRYARREMPFAEAEIVPHNRFFISEIMAVLTDKEVFVDAGAYDGSVTKEFIANVQGKFGAVLAFEPDQTNFTALKQAVAAMPNRGNIYLYQQALTAQAEQIAFAQGAGMAARPFTKAIGQAQAVPMDMLELAPTYIKLHLEGSELDALQGMEQTLRRHRPIVALTVYHNRDGLWKTAQWLKMHLPDYAFYFRLHAWCGTGAVIYALPKERQCNERV